MKKGFRPVKGDGDKNFIEQGAIIKRGKGLIRAALVYPNTYRAGMSSLGYQTVYKIANQTDFVSCERVFWEPPKRGARPDLKSLETGLLLDQFDIILFSISFENDFTHLVQLLGEAGIPLRSPDRNHIHPLVVAGGVACFLNPEPIAPFIDCFLLGEAEVLLPDFFQFFSTEKDRLVFLNTLEQQIPGAYVPSIHADDRSFSIDVQYLKNLEKADTASVILSSDTAFKQSYLIETLKGCPHGCRFCSAGFIYRPPRIYPEKNILHQVDIASEKTKKIGLVSSAVADHPKITDICNYAVEKGLEVSFSSLRADKLDDAFLKCLTHGKVKTATIAPEAGSQRMRDVINKKLTHEDILCAAGKLVQSGIMNLRLYFMIGLPFETIRDVEAIVNLTTDIKAAFLEESRKKKKIGTITLSINPFIPKPATPFQWSPMNTQKELKQKAAVIRDGLKKTANVKINFESFRNAKIHALLSLGDKNMADVIEYALDNSWSKACKKYQSYCDDLIYRQKDINEHFAWEFINNNINRQFLAEEYQKASQAKKSSACPMTDCSRCRICSTI